ncbi:SRPBCC domain-containing protein [Sphingobacterium suaedae]|uniref:SRPBCC domain-containing protein n=1 Tax=Sphingobacterium suaedae TaxID=1686402 RepID=A0ABW5KF35_9SPHI
MATQTKMKVEAKVNAPVEKVWQAWNTPTDIMKWNTPDPSWHCPSSENDLRLNGSFKNRMEAKDGSFGFDFEGVYSEVDLHKKIAYSMADGRAVVTVFENDGVHTSITTHFDPETENDPEFQRQGWQAILDSFVRYVTSENH